MQRDEKLNYLMLLRKDIGEEQFKFAAAAILAKAYSELLQWRSIKRSRMNVLDRINLMLRSMGCDEVSYGFIRQFL
ncbi:hypothetical protein QNH39_07015 [Neobacillus novalis]|uniref:Uncharacterized protein n=1 Tax=Neobacillus novalis TaxID=220687 RepID=A0AA95MWK8_9BACI|nr:hypothetical protein [Neobacillus novalis]WHY87573.1 hypothetical protein QNH39_07015 [Neobacillus novalis]